ncbi:hypothetical protein [Alternaria alternata botybirnavirus 1]|nr:hypothetical protein [Alternaria alternata botybirnavirus 1]
MPYNTQNVTSSQENKIAAAANAKPQTFAEKKGRKQARKQWNATSKKGHVGFFDGYCYLVLFNKGDRDMAKLALGAWPTALSLKEYVFNNKISLSLERVSALMVLAPDSVDAVVGYHLVPGALFPAEALYAMTDKAVVGGVGIPLDQCVHSALWVLFAAAFVATIYYGRFLVSASARPERVEQRKLVSLGRKGFKANKMPTKSERAGAKAAGIYKDDGGMEPVAQQQDNTNTLWEAITTWVPNEKLASAESYGRVIIQPSATRLVSMTGALMNKLGKFRFRDTFTDLKPSSELMSVSLAWGYNLDKLPTLRVGTAYVDKHDIALWSKKPEGDGHYISAYNTGIGYVTPRVSANQHIAGVTDSADQLVDPRDIANNMDSMKKLPAEFVKAGNVKAQYGDNHVGMLVQWLLQLWAVKQAEEQGAKCYARPDTKVMEEYVITVKPESKTRETTDTKIAQALSDVWLWASGKRPWNMVLLGDSAGPLDAFYTMYLCGMLMSTTDFKYKGNKLNIVPSYYMYQTNIRDYVRIPLCNQLQTIDLTDLSESEYLVSSGALEFIIIDYVRRMGLQDQLHNAQLIASSLIVSDITDKVDSLSGRVPMPHHVQEYDLWASKRAQGRGTTLSLVQGENFTLMSVLLQVQRGVLMDTLASKMIERVESRGVPMMTTAGEMEASIFLTEVLGAGASQLMSAWGSHMFGYVSAEQEKLLHTDATTVSRYLEDVMTTGRFRPTSCMLAGTTVETGALSLVWNETLRAKEAAQIFVNKPFAVMLAALYSEKKQIFETEGPFMLGFTDFGSRNRDHRLTISSTGLRRLRTIIGQPKILYIGVTPEETTMAKRLAHVGTGPQLSKHYEPFFDADSAAQHVVSDLPIRAGPGNTTVMHKSEPKRTTELAKPTGGRSRRPSLSNLGAGIVATVGRLLESKSKGLSTVPMPPRLETEFVPEIAPSPATYESIVPDDCYDAYINGVWITVKKTEKEAVDRAIEAEATMSDPALNKASEIITSNPVYVNRAITKAYARADFGECEVQVPSEYGRDLYDHIQVVETLGDGRCGARALHTQMVQAGADVTLQDVFAAEARICEVDGRRVPKEIWATDEVLALIAGEFKFDLAIYVESEEEDPRVDSIRVIDAANTGKYLEILSQPTHWSAMRKDFELNYATSTTIEETVTEYIDSLAVRLPTGATQEEKGMDRSKFPAKTPKCKKPYVARSPRTAEHELVAEVAKSCKTQEQTACGLGTQRVKEHGKLLATRPLVAKYTCTKGELFVESRYTAMTWDEHVRNVANVHGGVSNEVCEVTTLEMDGSPIAPSTLGMTNQPAMTTRDMLHHLVQNMDDGWHHRQWEAFCNHYRIEENDRDHFLGHRTRGEVLKAMGGYWHTPYHMVEVDEDNGVIRIMRVTTFKPEKTLPGDYYPSFLLFKNNIFGLELGKRMDKQHPVRKQGLYAYLTDIRTVYDNMDYAAANDLGARADWNRAVETKLAEMGVEQTSTKVICTTAEMDTIFKKGTGEGEAAQVRLGTNMERLSGAMMLAGYRREARWVLYNATSWAKTNLGMFPSNPEWIDERAVAMLANAKGVKLWVINTSQRRIEEWSCKTTEKTLPVVMYADVDGTTLYPCSAGANAATLDSISRFNAHCKRLQREHGRIPEPPSEMPMIPDTGIQTGLAVGSIAAISLGGIAVAAVIGITGMTLYRRKMAAKRVGAGIATLVREQGDRTDAEAEQPLLDIETPHAWEDDWSRSSSHHVEGEVLDDRLSQCTLNTVPLGGDPLGATPTGPLGSGAVRNWSKVMLSKMN